MYKIAICDDEIKVCESLEKALYQYDGINFDIKVYRSGKDMLCDAEAFDVVFLDIKMPEMNGLETAKAMRLVNEDICIVFLTNDSAYVQDAFRVRAYRYYKKPIAKESLFRTLAEIEDDYFRSAKITIANNGDTHIINISKITHIESYGDGTYIYTCSGKVYDSKKSLKYWQNYLCGHGFVKVHQSFIIALSKIITLYDNKAELIYGYMVPVSRRNLSKLRSDLNNYIEKYAKVI